MKKNKTVLRVLARLGIAVIVLVVAGYVIGIRLLNFPGESMAPAVEPGDTLVTLVGPWHARSPRRFDMVVFDLPPDFAADNVAWHKVPWMKRLIGLPGEHVQIQTSGVFVDEKKMDFPLPSAADEHMKFLDVQLGTDEYFVIGDNPVSSVDSRSFGPLHRHLLKGAVWHVIHHGP